MRSHHLSPKLLLSFLALMLLGAIVVRGNRVSRSPIKLTTTDSAEDGQVTSRSGFSCLPKDVRFNDVVTYGGTKKENVTVEKLLVEMKAKCRNGLLVDAKRREIRFFRSSCWGNPPANYRDIQKLENEELEKLKRRYTVIVFECNPMIQ